MTGLPEKRPTPQEVSFPRFDQLTVENIGIYAEDSIAVAAYHVNGIKTVHVESQPLTWDNTVGEIQGALEALGYEGEGGRWPMLMAAVHPDETIREAADEAYTEQHTFMLGMYTDEDLYRVFKIFSESDAATGLEGERALALKAVMKEFEMAGWGLEDETKRAKLLELRTEIQKLGKEFRSNMANDAKKGLELSDDEKQEFAAEQLFLPRDDNGNIVDPADHRLPLNKPAIDAVLEHSANRDLRRKAHQAFNSLGAPENLAVLTKIANKRLEIAQTLGYDSWTDLQTEGQLLASPEEVLASYENLHAQISGETAQLLTDIKSQFELEHDVEPYDVPYYVTQMRKEVDEQISEFLPYENVVSGLFSIAKELFGVEVREITEHADRHEGQWHNSVKFYEITDGDGTLLGRFAIDPHPRPGKRAGAATYTLQGPNRDESGEYNTPVTVIVANTTPPSAEGEEAKLTPYDLRVLFHEFGHVLHATLGKTDTVRLAGGYNLQEDFRELVSVFFERLADDPDTLRHLTPEDIPDVLAESYAKAQRITSLLLAQRNLRSASFDLAMHSIDAGLTDEALTDIRLQAEAFSGIREGEVGAGWPASFRHMLVDNYAGRMQVYTWAAEQAREIQRLFDQAGDNGARQQVGLHLRAMMARGGADTGRNLLERFMRKAQVVVREATVRRGIGSAAAESSKP